MILTDFFATRIRIIDTVPDPGGQNDADPDPHHWFNNSLTSVCQI